MAPVIWGLDLSEMKWSKFKSSYMWNREYHIRRTKFIVYQLALIFCVVSESLGTACLSDYIQGQKKVERVTNKRVRFFNNDYVGAGSYNIFAGVFVAFIFGAAFFFDLFWPERKESRGVRIAWKVCGVLAVVIHLAAALTITIITAMHSSYVIGQQDGREDYYWKLFKHHREDPLSYKHNPRAIAAVVFAWLGFASVVPSCALLFMSIDNVEKGKGPKSKHARERDAVLDAERGESNDHEASEKSVTEPEPVLTHQAQNDGTTDAAPAAEEYASR